MEWLGLLQYAVPIQQNRAHLPASIAKFRTATSHDARHPCLRLQVDEFVEEEAEGLRAKAEDAKAELDKLADLQNLRAEVAFNSALAGGGGARWEAPACRVRAGGDCGRESVAVNHTLQVCVGSEGVGVGAFPIQLPPPCLLRARRLVPTCGACTLAAPPAADINREADEFEEQLRKSREEREVRLVWVVGGWWDCVWMGMGWRPWHAWRAASWPGSRSTPLVARLTPSTAPALPPWLLHPAPSPPARCHPAAVVLPPCLPACPAQASEREQEQWEDDVAVARSQGQFFQTLYQTNKKRPVGMNAEQLQVGWGGCATCGACEWWGVGEMQR